MQHPDRWSSLRDRYSDPTRPHRLLAIDGGGIRGMVALGMLQALERQVREKHGPVRLCEYFDYVAGTSTGAIIAAGIARGMEIADLIGFYRNQGPSMFEKTRLLARLYTLYQDDPLKRELQRVFGAETTLGPEHLRCLLLVVTRNATTDSWWPISSNPEAKYNHPKRRDCNLQIPLWQLVRASTAAPVFFPPEVLNWDSSDPTKSFQFVDGGMTPYNNPSFLLYRMATQKAFRLGWATGEEKLLLVSVGTGASDSPQAAAPDGLPHFLQENLVTTAAHVPGTLMHAISQDQDTNCRTVGRCTHGAPLDREVADLIERDLEDDAEFDSVLAAPPLALSRDTGRRFLYARYDADLSPKGLAKLGCDGLDSARVRAMDCVDAIDDLLRIGQAAGRGVSLGHFGALA